MQPTLSLIVPTRGRPDPLRRFLDSIARTATRPGQLEVVLVVDADDPGSAAVGHPRLRLRHVVGPPGRTMGALNMDGYAASTGEYVMLLNDDVLARTPGWDRVVLRCFRRFPDPIALVHVNDTLIEHHLCTFPLVSRAFCELAGGICPREYRRYRIDDHIEDVFNLLAYAGVRRTVYLPEVVFEHTNAVEHAGGRVYMADPEILARDAPTFDRLFPARKAFAQALLRVTDRGRDPGTTAARIGMLEDAPDSLALRTPGRQHVGRLPVWARLRNRLRRDGIGGLIRAAARRLGVGD